jgi:hypothetical protein
VSRLSLTTRNWLKDHVCQFIRKRTAFLGPPWAAVRQEPGYVVRPSDELRLYLLRKYERAFAWAWREHRKLAASS